MPLNLHKTLLSTWCGGPGVGPICGTTTGFQFLLKSDIKKSVGGIEQYTSISAASLGVS